MPLYEMDEVEKFMGLYPSQRIISSEGIEVQGNDLTLSNQQFVIMSSWLNDQEVM